MEYSIIESFIIGILSGAVGSWIITHIYRKVDAEKDRFEYINELCQFAISLSNITFYATTLEIEDSYVEQVYEFCMKNLPPVKKNWVRLKKEETKVCNKFNEFYQETVQEVVIAHLNIKRVKEGEEQYRNDLEGAKVLLMGARHLVALDFIGQFGKLRNNYIK